MAAAPVFKIPMSVSDNAASSPPASGIAAWLISTASPSSTSFTFAATLCVGVRKPSTGSMNISLFHKPSHPDSVLTHLNTMRKQCMFTDVTLWAGDRSFPCHRAVLAACSRYFEAMFSGGLRESLDSDVNFRDSIHPE
eukprot:superscaffoldBa00008310_g23245